MQLAMKGGEENMGVYSRKNKDGSASWTIQYFVDGQRKREVVPAKTKKQAELALAKRKIEIKEGRFWENNNQRQVLFRDWAKEYLEIKKLQGRRSFSNIQWIVSTLADYFNSKKLSEITPSMIEAFIAKRKSDATHSGKPPTPATINRQLAQLKNLFNEAVRNEILVKSPAQFIGFLKENNERDRVLSDEEFQSLLSVATQPLNGILLMAYYTGMRRGEILGLTWGRVDLKKKILYLRPEDTKTDEPRKIPINETLYEYLQQQNKVRRLHEPHVFTYKQAPIKEFKNSFATALEKAGIENFRFHDLRHTFVTNMRKAGIHDFVTMAITGHKTMEMFQRYNTVDEADLNNAIQAISIQNPIKKTLKYV